MCESSITQSPLTISRGRQGSGEHPPNRDLNERPLHTLGDSSETHPFCPLLRYWQSLGRSRAKRQSLAPNPRSRAQDSSSERNQGQLRVRSRSGRRRRTHRCRATRGGPAAPLTARRVAAYGTERIRAAPRSGAPSGIANEFLTAGQSRENPVVMRFFFEG
jgi:hypothetical protein